MRAYHAAEVEPADCVSSTNLLKTVGIGQEDLEMAAAVVDALAEQE